MMFFGERLGVAEECPLTQCDGSRNTVGWYQYVWGLQTITREIFRSRAQMIGKMRESGQKRS